MTDVLCEKDKYIAELESEVFRLQDELSGDGVLTLAEQVEHARGELRRVDSEHTEMVNTFRNIDALIDAHRLERLRSADELSDEIIGMISELERKVGEIT